MLPSRGLNCVKKMIMNIELLTLGWTLQEPQKGTMTYLKQKSVNIIQFKEMFGDIFHCYSDKIELQTFNAETGVMLAL